MKLKDIEKLLCEPSPLGSGWPSGCHSETGIYRLHTAEFDFIEYKRSEIRKIMKELEMRIMLVSSHTDTYTATDRFVLFILQSMAGGWAGWSELAKEHPDKVPKPVEPNPPINAAEIVKTAKKIPELTKVSDPPKQPVPQGW